MFRTKPWYRNGLKFECSQCGNCCKGPTPGHVWVDSADFRKIAEFLNVSEGAFTHKYVRKIGMNKYSLTEKPNHDCVFWSDEGGCTIYSVRPMQCRTFPFWTEVLATKKTWRDQAKKCRGMNQGATFSLDQIHAIRDGRFDTRSFEDQESDSDEVSDGKSNDTSVLEV